MRLSLPDFADIYWSMIDVLRNLFRAESPHRTEVPHEVAVAALLIEAAKADGVYDAAERAAVLRILREMFGLSPEGAMALHDQGELAQQSASDVVRFTRVIKTGLTEVERINFMESLWSVVLADNERDPNENALMRNLVPLVAVSDRDSAVARQRAMAKLAADKS